MQMVRAPDLPSLISSSPSITLSLRLHHRHHRTVYRFSSSYSSLFAQRTVNYTYTHTLAHNKYNEQLKSYEKKQPRQSKFLTLETHTWATASEYGGASRERNRKKKKKKREKNKNTRTTKEKLKNARVNKMYRWCVQSHLFVTQFIVSSILSGRMPSSSSHCINSYVVEWETQSEGDFYTISVHMECNMVRFAWWICILHTLHT